MLMPKSSDLLTTGYCSASRIRLVHAEVTDSARALEQNHLCGPTAGLVLAEALSGVALLGAELTQADETVSLRLRVSGPVQGILVEAAADGALRGYPHIKILNDLDDREDLDVAAALGEQGEVQVVRSLPGHILAHGTLEVRPAAVRAAVQGYLEQSLQRTAWVQTSALSYGGYLDQSRSVMAECLPDGDRQVFARLRGLFDDGSALEALESAPSLDAWADEMGLGEVRCDPARPLRFECRCSQARAEAILAALSTQERVALVATGQPATIHCHMCGRAYTIAPERVAAMPDSGGAQT